MSDLRFARELGAQFERLEHAGGARPVHRGIRPGTARLTGRIAIAMAFAVPLVIAVFAVLSLTRRGGHPATSAAATHGLALGGGNCRTPVRTAPLPGGSPTVSTSDGLIRGDGGRVSGLAWQLRVKANAEYPGAVEHGRLNLGTRQYGLCGQQAVPLPFGLINAGSHGIVYGYVADGGGGYRVTISAGATPLTTTATHTDFFIASLPQPACSYDALSVTATSVPVGGLPPDIERSLDAAATRFTTTMRFGDCRPNALVTAVSERSETQGRSPNAPLARVIAQRTLTAPPVSHSRAGGTLWELVHDGQRGISLLAVRLDPGRYGIWLRGPHGHGTRLGEATVKHELNGSYDLPAGPTGERQIVIASQPPGQIDNPGQVVLRATLP